MKVSGSILYMLDSKLSNVVGDLITWLYVDSSWWFWDSKMDWTFGPTIVETSTTVSCILRTQSLFPETLRVVSYSVLKVQIESKGTRDLGCPRWYRSSSLGPPTMFVVLQDRVNPLRVQSLTLRKKNATFVWRRRNEVSLSERNWRFLQTICL